LVNKIASVCVGSQGAVKVRESRLGLSRQHQYSKE